MECSKFFIFIGAAFLFSAGCTQKQQPRTTKQVTKQLCFKDATKSLAIDIAEDVLTDLHFSINKKDTEPGIVTTTPLPGAKFFEIWRTDAVGTKNWIESNLHSLRKTARINITHNNKQLCINCGVLTERLSIPEHTVTSSARAYAMFTESGSSIQQLKLNPEQQRRMSWLKAGNDKKLASEILNRIRKQIQENSR